MDNQIDNKYKELIEKAKEHSKEQIISFISGICNVNPSLFEELWSGPIINIDEIDSILPDNLSIRTKMQISERLFEIANDHLFESPAAFIPLGVQYIPRFQSFTEQEQAFIEQLSYIIVYDEDVAKDAWTNGINKIRRGTTNSTIQDMEKKFISTYSEMFTHERMHLNTDILITDAKNDTGKEGSFVNGANLSEDEQISHNLLFLKYQDYNEVFVDTLAQIIEEYKQGDSIQDCLYKFIKYRKKVLDEKGGDSLFEDLKDKTVLAIFVLFPEELTEWGLFGAYEDARENVLMKKIDEVLEKPQASDDKKTDKNSDKEIEEVDEEKNDENIRKYIRKRQKEGNPISDMQKEMLTMLGIKEFGTQEIKKATIEGKVTPGQIYDVSAIISRGLNRAEQDVEKSEK